MSPRFSALGNTPVSYTHLDLDDKVVHRIGRFALVHQICFLVVERTDNNAVFIICLLYTSGALLVAAEIQKLVAVAHNTFPLLFKQGF